MEKLFPDLKGDELRVALEANASAITEESIERPLSAGSIADYKDRLADIQMRDQDIEDAIKSFTAPLRGERKNIKKESRDLTKSLRRGFKESTEKVYLMFDQAERKVSYYDENGEFVKSRKMRPEERQTTIVPLNQQQA